MSPKPLFLFLLLPLLSASTYTVKDGSKEVVKVETQDGSSQKEVVSEAKLKEEAGGYTKLKASELKNAEKDGKAAAKETLIQVTAVPRGNYGIAEGMSEEDVETLAAHANMGSPNKSTEYLAGTTYPVRIWSYEFEDSGLKHFYKVSFDSDGKVLRVNHQTGK